MKSYRNVYGAVKASRSRRINADSALFYGMLWCLFLIGAHNVHAQNIPVSGHVVGSIGKAIIGAQVDLTNTATASGLRGQTNCDGYAQFPPAAPGSYTAHANAPGFASYTLDRLIPEEKAVAWSSQLNVNPSP